MDFNKAVLAHSAWKKRLASHIDGKEQINADIASKDDQCDFGKWLITEGKSHGNLPAYKDVKAKHARFHAVAGNVARAAKTLPVEQARVLIDQKSEFTRASAECVNALVALKHALGQ